MKKYHYLLLDFDNTLVNFTETEKRALRHTFQKLYGRDLSDEEVLLYNRINAGYWEKLERKEVNKEQLMDGRMRDFAKALLLPEIDTVLVNHDYMETLSHTVVEYPDAFLVCKALAEQYKLFIITNGTDYVQHRRIEGTSFYEYIEKVFISDEVGVNKPAPEFMDAIIRATGDEDRSHYLIIGDSMTSDIQLGKNTGVDTCYVGTKEVMADYRIQALSELTDILH